VLGDQDAVLPQRARRNVPWQKRFWHSERRRQRALTCTRSRQNVRAPEGECEARVAPGILSRGGMRNQVSQPGLPAFRRCLGPGLLCRATCQRILRQVSSCRTLTLSPAPCALAFPPLTRARALAPPRTRAASTTPSYPTALSPWPGSPTSRASTRPSSPTMSRAQVLICRVQGAWVRGVGAGCVWVQGAWVRRVCGCRGQGAGLASPFGVALGPGAQYRRFHTP